MQCLQIPQFGAFYPPPQKEDSTPQEKRKRQVYKDGKRAVLPRLPCLLPGTGSAASWEAPELEDSREADGSNAVASGAPTLVTLQQAQPPASAPMALTEKSHPAEAESTKDPQLPPVLPQFNTATVQAQSQHAVAQEQQEALPQGALASRMSGVSEGAAKGSFQPQAAPQQVPFGQQLMLGSAAAAPSNQQSQIPVLGTPSNASTKDAAAFAGVPVQSATLPFQPVQPSAVPGQQPGLLFGQLTQQVQSLAYEWSAAQHTEVHAKLVLPPCKDSPPMALQHSV